MARAVLAHAVGHHAVARLRPAAPHAQLSPVQSSCASSSLARALMKLRTHLSSHSVQCVDSVCGSISPVA